MATADHVGKGESGMEKKLLETIQLSIEETSQELLYAALGEIIDRIEKCGASTELTNAVCLASDLRQAVGNKHNSANKFALKRVVDEIRYSTKEDAQLAG